MGGKQTVQIPPWPRLSWMIAKIIRIIHQFISSLEVVFTQTTTHQRSRWVITISVQELISSSTPALHVTSSQIPLLPLSLSPGTTNSPQPTSKQPAAHVKTASAIDENNPDNNVRTRLFVKKPPSPPPNFVLVFSTKLLLLVAHLFFQKRVVVLGVCLAFLGAKGRRFRRKWSVHVHVHRQRNAHLLRRELLFTFILKKVIHV